jgi:hypothetical protein
LTQEQKLKILEEAWGYLEVTQATVMVSGWKIWLVKNYSGRPIGQMNGKGLPGNPKAKEKLEFSGYNVGQAVNRAYVSTRSKKK